MSKTAFLFPGQGAQAVGMGKHLVETLPAAADIFQQANDVLGYDLAKICFDGPAEKLDSTAYSQPAIFVSSFAALASLQASAPEVVTSCDFAAGLSLGEYSALVFAGVMDFEAGLRVVQARGKAMQTASDLVASGMVSVLGLDRKQVQQICDDARVEGGTLQLANLLCPGNIAISGDKQSCNQVEEVAARAGAMKSIPLAVAGAFHTNLMQPALEHLTTALSEVEMQPPRIPVVSNVDAQTHADPTEIKQLLIQQVIEPVRWEDSMRFLINAGVEQFFEIGSGRVLRGLLRRIDRKISCENITC